MPIYEYICKKCDHRFETLVLRSAKPECPKCKSRSLAKQFSVFATQGKSEDFSNLCPNMGENGHGGCGGCGDPRGPGACAMNDE